ncbi:MAG: hypothetical protein JNK64_13640 [Myxococcales bacterium]|nr:hypothetical protein [Myxococcales bacterium]
MYWSLHRATALSERERRDAAAHVLRWRNVLDGYDLCLPAEAPRDGDLVAWGSLRPSHGDPRRSDHGGYLLAVMERVFDAMTELRGLFADAELAFADDFGTYGWAGDGWEPQVRTARQVGQPAHRDGWVAASALAPWPAPISPAAAALLAGDPTAAAVSASVAASHGVSGLAPIAGWAEALAARLALDGWAPRPWTADVLDAIAALGARSTWRAVALAVDAGVPGAAAALARLVDRDACAALTKRGAPSWAVFADLVGHTAVASSAGAAVGDAVRHAIRSLVDAGGHLQGVGRYDDDEAGAPISPAARAAIAAFATAAAPLGLPLDEATQPLLAPGGAEEIDELDDAFAAVIGAVAARLAPALTGALGALDRAAWRALAVAAALEPRETAAAEAPVAPAPVAAPAAPPVAAPPSGIAAALTRLDAVVRDATTPPPAPADEALVDALLSMLAAPDDVPPAARLAELGLAADYRRDGRSERCARLARRLAELDAAVVVARVLARAEQLIDVYEIGPVFTPRLDCVVGDPALMERVLAVWHEAFAARWRGAFGLVRLIAPLAGTAPVFTRLLDVVAAPDRDRAGDDACFDLLAYAVARKDDAVAALAARLHADRGNPRAVWRHLAYRGLRELGSPDAVATAILEFTAPERVREAAVMVPLIARDATLGAAILERLVDLPEVAIEVTRAIGRHAGFEALGRRLLAHPAWQVRLAAARAISDGDTRRAYLAAAWRSIDAARVAVPSDERARDHEGGPIGAPVELPPLPALVEGLTSTCADHRHAALRGVDDRRDPADAAALVWGDELDRALQRRGHRRAAPRWHAWREVAPALAAGRSARLAWARAAAGPLPDGLARVRDLGADAVAAGWPPPYLVLTDDERASLTAVEAPLVARGAALLWGPA